MDGMSDDDLSEYADALANGPAWEGKARGGPLDGAPISVGMVEATMMSGIEVYVRLGRPGAPMQWHAYSMQNPVSPVVPGSSIMMPENSTPIFQHLGVIDGDPPTPDGV